MTEDMARTGQPRGSETRARRLGGLARLFLKLRTIALGGPAAHITMMDDEVVRKRNWLTREQFLDLLGATNLIPGPNSTEMAIHIGPVRACWRGLIVAGSCFIFPAVVIVLALARAYVRYGSLPEVLWLLYGVKQAIIAIVVHALWGFAAKAPKVPPPGWWVSRSWPSPSSVSMRPCSCSRWSGIFFPSFVFGSASNLLIPRLRRFPWAAGFLDGASVPSLGLMATVT